uniref:Deoxynucleoside kinase domain-containing protein n=1 Tax=Plectus sambesii TaxID=2011161 RepID=A0A914UY95_9BILA
MGSGLVTQMMEKTSLTDKVHRARHPKDHVPKVIVVEGNVGAGKSTTLDLIQTLSSDVVIMHEPFDVWTSLAAPDGEHINMLENFYDDPAKFSMLFQVLVQSSYSRAFFQAYELAEQNKARYLVVERSFPASQQIFTAVIRQKKQMSDAEFAILEHSMATAAQINPKLFECDHLIYLKCPAEVCMDRKIARSRPEEMAAVTIGYLLQLEEAYERWFARGFSPLNAHKTTIINTDCSMSALKDSLQYSIRL